jgi:hypothetical protein
MIEVRANCPSELVNEVSERFAAGGGSFSRWSVGDVRILVDCMVRVEDRIELQEGSRPHVGWAVARKSIRTVRRRLEDEL